MPPPWAEMVVPAEVVIEMSPPIPEWETAMPASAAVMSSAAMLTEPSPTCQTATPVVPAVIVCATVRSTSEFTIVEIGVAESDLFGIVAALGNELPEFMAPGFTSTVGRSGWRHYFAMDNRIPVATAASRADGDVAWFGFAGTLPSHRGRGAQSALLARRIRDAAADGCAWVTCETMADTAERPSRSFRNMMRLGFTVAYARKNFILALR